MHHTAHMAGGGELWWRRHNFSRPNFVVVIIVDEWDVDDGPNVVIVVDGRDIHVHDGR